MSANTIKELVRLRKASGPTVLAENMKLALSRATNDAAKEFLIGRLTELERGGKMGSVVDEATLTRIADCIETEFGKPLMQFVKRPFLETITHSYADGKEGVNADFSLTAPDLAAIEILRKYNTVWVADAMSDRAGELVREMSIEALEKGWTRDTLATELQDRTKGMLDRSQSYWRTVADHWVHKSHNLGSVSGYEEARIEKVKVVAILDKRTSAICRAMNGRILPVAAMASQRDAILKAAKGGNLATIKEAQIMVQNGKEPFGEKASAHAVQSSGLLLPPFHFGCRTVLVAYFGGVAFFELVEEAA